MLIKDIIIIIKVIKIKLLLIIRLITNHLGINPNNGGNPLSLSKLNIIKYLIKLEFLLE